MIALDVGNSRVKFALFPDGPQSSASSIPSCTRFLACSLIETEFPWPQIETLFRFDLSPTGVAPTIIATSVNARGLSRVLSEWPDDRWPRPRVIQSNAELPIVNRTSQPEKVGIDRLLKAVAANLLRTANQPIVVVDSGTATTVDWINEQGEFLGGAILPGLALSSKALHDHTDQLPLIDSRQLGNRPPQAIGQETTSALQSGLFWGQVGAVRELIQRMALEQIQSSPPVLVTGGGGEFLANYLDQATYRPALTLEGLVVTARTFGSK